MLGGWLPMGIPLITALLDQVGVTSRVVRIQDAPSLPSHDLVELIYETLYRNPSLDLRLHRIRTIAERETGFFDLILSRLLAGPERVFGFSVWRMNADITLEVARRLKEHRPEALIVFGGPEVSESASDFYQDWVDVVVWGSAESVVVPVVQALLDRQPAEASIWDNVWVNPKHDPGRRSPTQHGKQPPIPRIDYTTLVPLQVGAARPSFPVMMNLGCPFRCGFCPNTTIYPELGWGSPERVVEEMVEITRVWAALHPDGQAPQLELQICDAALNADPHQFDRLCNGLIAADWPARPTIGSLIIIDKRMTAERAKLALEAGLHQSFFGLESANPRLRRTIKKPGKKEEIAAALQTCRDQGWIDSLGMGIIIGWPDETEEEFYESVEFLDWALALGIISSVSVMPLIRTPGMMDPSLLGGAEGEARGLLWRLPTAAGSPNIRARRFFHVLDHFDGLVPVASSIPHQIVADSMLSGCVPAFWERWLARHAVEDADAARHLIAKFWSEPDPAASFPTEEPVSLPTNEAGALETQSEPNADEQATSEDLGLERTLVGRGETVVLRLDRAPGARGIARAHDHMLSYRGSDLPAPLRPVVLELGRAVRQLPKAPAVTEDVWRNIARIVEHIAPDVRLED
jgi:hypothetical protein